MRKEFWFYIIINVGENCTEECLWEYWNLIKFDGLEVNL